MREFLEELLAQATALAAAAERRAGDGSFRCEFVEAFAKPYPSLAIATVMGAPLEDAPRLHHWSNWIQRQFDAASMASEREEIEPGGGGVLRVRRSARERAAGGARATI